MATESVQPSRSDGQPRDPEMIYDTSVPDEFEGNEIPPWRSSRAHSSSAADVTTPRNLGYLSLALGMGAVCMPSRLARLSGMEQHRGSLPFVGLRELASGIGLLSQANKAPWLWSRVVGDGMDLAFLLSSVLNGRNPRRVNAMITTAVVAAIAALDVKASTQNNNTAPRASLSAPDAYVANSVIVNKTAQECYEFWRNPTNLTRISPMLESVTAIDERTSRWVARGVGGTKVEWKSRITADAPGDRIAWRSLEGGSLYHAGVVSFQKATGGRGTLVNATFHFRVPGGRAALALAKVLGVDPRTEAREDLRRFKAFLEAGEIPTTRGQPSGRRSLFGRMTREGRLSRQGSAS